MRSRHTIQIDADRCIGCGLCRKDCPTGNILIKNKKARVVSQDCIMCGHCVAICPRAAVSMTGFGEAPEEITKPVVLEPQALLAAIKTRRSIRHFKKQQVEPEVISQVIEAGRLTPTGGNAQDVSFVVLKDGIDRFENVAVRLFRRLLPLMKLISPSAGRVTVDDHFFFKEAPVAIVIVSKNQTDGSLAAANMELMAEACGLGVLYSGFFTMAVNWSRQLKKKLGLRKGDRAAMTLVLGYPGVKYHRTAQKEAAVVRHL